MKPSGSMFGGETCVPLGDGNRTFPKKWHQTETFCVRVPWGWVLAYVHVIFPARVNTNSIMGKRRTNANKSFFQ